MTDGTLSEQVDRGERAKQILDDPLFKEAFKKARDDIFTEFELSKWDDRERREFLDKELRALRKIAAYLQTLLINGHAASKKLREDSKIARWM